MTRKEQKEILLKWTGRDTPVETHFYNYENMIAFANHFHQQEMERKIAEVENFDDSDSEFLKQCNLYEHYNGCLKVLTDNDEGAFLDPTDIKELIIALQRYINSYEKSCQNGHSKN